jgi:glycolate oxidase FAD binding subunit
MTQVSTSRANKLESVLDPSRVNTEPAALGPYAIHGVAPGVVARPGSVEEAGAVVRFAVAQKLSVIPSGCRSKLSLGPAPSSYDIALDMTGLREIAHYDPADLTISVDAGMPLAALNATLFQHGQFLPLLAPFYSSATVGGTIASGLDSPLRQFYGTARDFLLGAEFIDGTGAQVKSGGRVVKNVTGYDMHKLLIGSLGNLAVITRLNFRTFPAPAAGSRGFVASFSTREGALALRKKIADSPLAPLTLDVLNPVAAKIFATRTPAAAEAPVFAGEDHGAARISLALPGGWFRCEGWQVCAAFAGVPEVLERCSRDVNRFAEEARAESATFLDDSTRPSVWGRLREALPLFAESAEQAAVFRLSILPSLHAAAITLLESVAHAANIPMALVARASGPLYVAFLANSEDQNTVERLGLLWREIFTLSRSHNGDAVLLFAPKALRSAPAAQSAHPATRALAARIKSAFDPQNVFSPGRIL